MRAWAKRWLVPIGAMVLIAAPCAAIWEVVGGPTVFGLPWWMLPVLVIAEWFGIWWAFVKHGKERKRWKGCADDG